MAGYTGSIADAGRVIHIAKRREREKEDIELKRRKIAAENAVSAITDKFAAHYDAVEHQIKTSTVGLVTLEEMKARQELAVLEREKQLAHKKLEAELKLTEQEDENKKKKEEKLRQKACLSFDVDEDADEEENSNEKFNPGSSGLKTEESLMKKKIGKDPSVDTSFLPDKIREEEEDKLREQLRAEWAKKQEQLKEREINIAFSYWDGSGHRRDIKVKTGIAIHQFLTQALEVLRKDFAELKIASPDFLMFVKEDLIIPHFYTFYDFIVTKAMGKTGPLFEFDSAGEIRIRTDASVEVAESHPAKVVLRNWYERNKHIYPASRWEPFDPNKRYDRKNIDE